jgi:hypothetical protein
MSKEIKLEELQSRFTDFLTVGKLKKALEKYPDDAKVLIQRVEDRYYDGNDISGMTGLLPDGTYGILPEGSKAEGWPVVKKEGAAYHHALHWNEEMNDEVLRKIAGEEPHYSFDNPQDRLYTQKQIDELQEEYSPAWGVVHYKDDPNNLYIDLHY